MRELLTKQMVATVAVVGFLGTGCDKGSSEKTGDTSAKGSKTATAATAKPAKTAKAPKIEEMAAAFFFRDYKSLKGMALLNKYSKGVIVGGPILKIITEMDKSMAVWLDAGSGNWVSMKFKDKGAAARKAKVKKGHHLKAQCKVGGAADKYVALIDCVFKE